MRTFIQRVAGDESGQAMAEYIIIVAMVAIACIVVVRLFGNDIKKMFSNARNELTSGN
jgi:Flp pilus assembly pilin Flp